MILSKLVIQTGEFAKVQFYLSNHNLIKIRNWVAKNLSWKNYVAIKLDPDSNSLIWIGHNLLSNFLLIQVTALHY